MTWLFLIVVTISIAITLTLTYQSYYQKLFNLPKANDVQNIKVNTIGLVKADKTSPTRFNVEALKLKSYWKKFKFN